MRTKSLFLFAKVNLRHSHEQKQYICSSKRYLSRSLFPAPSIFPFPFLPPLILFSYSPDSPLLFPSTHFPLSLSLMACSSLRRRNDKRSAILLRNGKALPGVSWPAQEERQAVRNPPALGKPRSVRIRRAHGNRLPVVEGGGHFSSSFYPRSWLIT